MNEKTTSGKIIRHAVRLLLAGRLDLLSYGVWKRMKGLDLGFVSMESLGLSPGHSNWHTNSGGPNLARVLNKLNIPGTSRALDLGSGKGGAVFTLSRFPFVEILGVEISPELVRVAEANLTRLGLQNVHFLCADAIRFTDIDRFTYIYMFNPFPCAVVKQVLDNIAVSLARTARRLTLIYNNPVCHDTIMESGLFRMDKQYSFHDGINTISRVYMHD